MANEFKTLLHDFFSSNSENYVYDTETMKGGDEGKALYSKFKNILSEDFDEDFDDKYSFKSTINPPMISLRKKNDNLFSIAYLLNKYNWLYLSVAFQYDSYDQLPSKYKAPQMAQDYKNYEQDYKNIEPDYKNYAESLIECINQDENSRNIQYDSRTIWELNKTLICYKKYEKFQNDSDRLQENSDKFPELPEDKELSKDLTEMMQIYNKIVNFHQEENDTRTPKEKLTEIHRYISARGYNFSEDLIANYYLSLKSKPFVILAGISGTGKTKLPELFAEAIGAKEHYFRVPVRPDWSDSNDLFGYENLKGEFKPGPVFEAFKDAYNNPTKPVFLCLDEMNLARVEYYLSDILSIIESRHWETKDGEERITTDPIHLNSVTVEEVPWPICKTSTEDFERGIPDNLYLVGTVNMDETTFPFSKKVLDRANTIEFNEVHFQSLTEEASSVDNPEPPLNENNDFLRSRYVNVEDLKNATDKDLVSKCYKEFNAWNQTLADTHDQFGYRVGTEIAFYMLNNKEAGFPLSENDAFDLEIMQKILPRIKGSNAKLETVLDDLLTKVDKYPNSAQKIRNMLDRLNDDGFTSYWL